MNTTDAKLPERLPPRDGPEITAALLNEFDRKEMNRTENAASWQHLVAPFRHPDTGRSVAEYVGNFVGAAACEAAGLYCVRHLPWLTPLFALLLGGWVVRIFITFHDCGHGSYFKSQKWNDRAGIFAGFFMLTPYYAWRKVHAIHHATSGDLDRRGTGDVLTLTLEEYLALSPGRRRGYRVARHPLGVVLLGAVIVFFVIQRFAGTWGFRKEDALSPSDVRNIHVTTAANALVLALVWAAGGWPLLLFVHLPGLLFATAVGVFLFYVQHQYEGAYWRRHDEWSFLRCSLEGSSWLRLPKVLQFFTGNIGIHHLHHLAPKVPNYKLQRCVDSSPLLREGVKVIGLGEAIRTLWLAVYDEENKRLLTFREVDRILATREAGVAAEELCRGRSETTHRPAGAPRRAPLRGPRDGGRASPRAAAYRLSKRTMAGRSRVRLDLPKPVGAKVSESKPCHSRLERDRHKGASAYDQLDHESGAG